jgi:predicted HAD superfamily Cof-like phosphohydrolase
MHNLTEIVQWNAERGLLKKFNITKECEFIVEELIEAHSDINSKEAREYSEEITKDIQQYHKSKVPVENIVDAFADIIVFATGAIAKNGYNPDKVMAEVQKEINDRTGKMIDGKFVKDIKENPYKADFSICEYTEEEKRELGIL